MTENDRVDITGCDLVALFKRAYECSVPQGLGHLHYRNGTLPDETLADILARLKKDGGVSLDYVHGRAVKFHVFERDGRLYTYSRWYDHQDYQLADVLYTAGVSVQP